MGNSQKRGQWPTRESGDPSNWGCAIAVIVVAALLALLFFGIIWGGWQAGTADFSDMDLSSMDATQQLIASTTTTTSRPLSEEAERFLAAAQAIAADAISAAEDAVGISAAWDERTISFSEARAVVAGAVADLGALSLPTLDSPAAPELATSHDRLITRLVAVHEAAVDMLAGLDSSDDGTARRRAAALLVGQSERLARVLDQVHQDIGAVSVR